MIIKRIHYYLTFLFTLLATGVTLAQDGLAPLTPAIGDKFSLLTPPLTDKSISYLSQLFGSVGNVLHGTSGSLLAQVFNVFNLGLLLIAGAFASYTVFKSVLSTAQDGEFMGRQAKSMWVAVRTSLGVGVLAPVFNGYSAIQVAMMWIVVHGVGFADMAWSQALNYLKKGGVVYTPPQNVETKKYLDVSAYILKAQVCMYKSKKVYEDKIKGVQNALKKDPNNPTLKAEMADIMSKAAPKFQPIPNKNGNEFSFPGGVFPSSYGENACGTVSVHKELQRFTYLNSFLPDFVPTNSAGKRNAGVAEDRTECMRYYNQFVSKIAEQLSKRNIMTQDNARRENEQKYQACLETVSDPNLSTGLEVMVKDLSPMAQAIVEGEVIDPNSESNPLTTQQASRNKVVADLIGATADFMNLSIQARSGDDLGGSEIDEIYNTAKEAGWISAGSFYYDLGQLYRKLDQKKNIEFSLKPKIIDQSTIKNLGFEEKVIKQIVNWFGGVDVFKKFADQIIDERIASDQADMGDKNKQWEVSSGIEASAGKLIMKNTTNHINEAQNAFLHNASDHGNPILGLQRLGYTNIAVASGIFIFFFIYTMGLSAAGVIAAATPLVGTVGVAAVQHTLTMVAIILPLILFIVIALFATGFIFVIYVPLIPYILFIFGALGWLMLVLEAIVAAPLVALGITHPEGHDLMGKSEQAIMLALGVFLRPILMILGLIGGMVLSYVGLRVINFGFFHLIIKILTTGNTLGLGIFGPLVLLVMEILYSVIVIGVITQSYGLIYQVPDKVMRWIGGPDMSMGAPQILQRAEQSVQSTGKQIGEGAQTGGKLSGRVSQSASKRIAGERRKDQAKGKTFQEK